MTNSIRLNESSLIVITFPRPSSVIEVAASLPVIFFAYQSHEIVLPIYSGMAKPRSKNFIKSTVASLTLLFVIYTLGGTYGYLTFGSRVIADVIQMYDARDPVVTSGTVNFAKVLLQSASSTPNNGVKNKFETARIALSIASKYFETIGVSPK